MERSTIASLFTALRGGILREIRQEESTLRFRVELPALAQVENPDFNGFFAALMGCKEFSLQPFRNESTVIHQIDQIERLEVEIMEGKAEGDRVKVFCAHKGVSDGARLTIRADEFQVWNENFDGMDVPGLADLWDRRSPES